MDQVIAVFNSKGGVGKTTIAVNLAGELRGQVLDLDPDGHAARWGQIGDRTDISKPELGQLTDLREVTAKAAERARPVLLDCPPTMEGPSAYAIINAAVMLVPSKASMMDIAAARDAVRQCRELRESRGSAEPRLMLIPSMVRHGLRVGREAVSVLEGMGELVGPIIHERVAFVTSSIAGRTVGEYEPGGQAHREIKALARAIARLL